MFQTPDRACRGRCPLPVRLARTAVALAASSLLLSSSVLPAVASAEECPVQPGVPRITTQPVNGYGIPRFKVLATIPASPESVWRVVDDCNGYKRSMPRIIRSRELSRAQGKVRCQTEVEMPFPFSNIHSESENNAQVGPGRWQLDFRQIKGDYTVNEGSWVLQPCGTEGQSTRVEYTVHAVTKTVVPDAMLKRGMRSAMGDMLRKIGNLVAR